MVMISVRNIDQSFISFYSVGWSTGNPITISVGTVTNPVTKLLNVHGKIWCAIQGTIKVLNVQQLQVRRRKHVKCKFRAIISFRLRVKSRYRPSPSQLRTWLRLRIVCG